MFEEFAKEKTRRGLEGTERATIIMPWQNRAEYNDESTYVGVDHADPKTDERDIIINCSWAEKDAITQIIDSDFIAMGSDSTEEAEKDRKKFFEFLREREILSTYLDNFKNGPYPAKSFSEFQKNWRKHFYVKSAFPWDKTFQGENFWYKVDTQWQEFLRTESRPKEQPDNESAYISADKVGPEPEKNLLQQALDEHVGDEAEKNEQIKKEFFEFLFKQNVYADYMENLKNIEGRKDFSEFQKECLETDYVSSAFEWLEADQGLSFWSKVDKKWRAYLSNKAKPEEKPYNEKSKKEPEEGKIIINHPWAEKDSLRIIIDSYGITMGNAGTNENEQDRKEFFDFLYKREVLKDYLENIKNGCREEKGFSEFQKNCHKQKYIGDAFRWEETIQGYYFWQKIDREWFKYLQKPQNKTQPKEQLITNENDQPIANVKFKEIFFYFLDSYNYLAHYLLDMSRLKNISFDDFQKTVCPEKYLIDAFSWCETTYCWSEINSKWQDELKKIKGETHE